jgi:hypothetical protein
MNTLPNVANVNMLENFSTNELLSMRTVNKKFANDINYILRTRYSRLMGESGMSMDIIIKHLSYFEKNVLDPHKPIYMDLDVPAYIDAGTYHRQDEYARPYHTYIDGATVSIIDQPNVQIDYPSLLIGPQYNTPRHGVLVKKYTVRKILIPHDREDVPQSLGCFLLELSGEPKNSYVIINSKGGYEFIAPEPIVGIQNTTDEYNEWTTMITKNHFIRLSELENSSLSTMPDNFMEMVNIKDLIFGYHDNPDLHYAIASEPTPIQLSMIIPDEIRTIGLANDAQVIANIIAQGQHTYHPGWIHTIFDSFRGMVFTVNDGAEPYVVMP